VIQSVIAVALSGLLIVTGVAGIAVLFGAVGRLNVIFLANPNLSPVQTVELFQRVAPSGEATQLKRGQIPIAAYVGADKTWHVLSTKRQPCVQSYTVALNYALQATLGLKGALLRR
jgi:hypothetical protein